MGPTDTLELSSASLVLPSLTSEPRGGQGVAWSLHELGSEKRLLSEGHLGAAPNCRQLELLPASFKQRLTRVGGQVGGWPGDGSGLQDWLACTGRCVPFYALEPPGATCSPALAHSSNGALGPEQGPLLGQVSLCIFMEAVASATHFSPFGKLRNF